MDEDEKQRVKNALLSIVENEMSITKDRIAAARLLFEQDKRTTSFNKSELAKVLRNCEVLYDSKDLAKVAKAVP